MASLETRAGLKPSDKKLPFSITTSQVENYLQKKVDVLCSKNKGLPQNVDVRVYTTEASPKFLPFVVVLPTSVLVDKSKKDNNSHVDSFFNINERSSKIEDLQKPFKMLFGAYVYDKDDIKAFSSNDWRRARAVSRTTSETLKSMVFPRVSQFRGEGNRKTSVVTFMLDPLRVFHDMLKMEDDNRPYNIDIDKWQKIKTGEYRYMIARSVKGKNNKRYNDTFANELNRKMRGQHR